MKLVKQKVTGEREYLFDNIKTILIVLVVMGHLLNLVYDQSKVFSILYAFIYSFHMPVFIFVSGYFSRNPDKCREQAVEKFLIPYIVFCVLLQVEERILNIGIGAEMSIRILYPQWGLWYLLAIFWWRLFLKDFIRIRFILPLSILLGVMIGFSNEFTTFLSISRVFALLFFFLLGYYCTPKVVERIRSFPKILGGLSVILTAIFAYVFVYKLNFERSILYFRGPYSSEGELKQALMRLMLYGIAVLMIFAFINLCGESKNRFTYIGINSVSVYIFHLFVVKFIERFFEFNLSVSMNLFLIVIISILIAIITGMPIFTKKIEQLNGWIAKLVLK